MTEYENDLNDAAYRLTRALEALMTAVDLSEKSTGAGEADLIPPVQHLLNDLARAKANMNDTKALIDSVKAAAADQNEIITVTSALAKAADNEGDNDLKLKLTKAAAELTAGIKSLMDATRSYAKDSNNPQLAATVSTTISSLEASALRLIGDARLEAALSGLRYACKVASASLIKLATTATSAQPAMGDLEAKKELKNEVTLSDDNVKALLLRLKIATNDPRSKVRQNELLEIALAQLPPHSEFVASSKRATASISGMRTLLPLPFVVFSSCLDPTRRQEIDLAGTETSNSLRLLSKAAADVVALTGENPYDVALGAYLSLLPTTLLEFSF